jgi:hypothetical protein
MINTYNESSLHKSLKNLYSIEKNGKTEEKVDQWICDIVADHDHIIEIQTANISALRKKIIALINLKKTITVVHPIIVTKYIETYSLSGIFVSKRKSPKSETVYSMLKQITGIWDLLTRDNFKLELVYITCIEHRIQTETPVQLNNNSRRFYRKWIPAGKKLETIITTQSFTTLKDYTNLLPSTVPDPFTSKELNKAIQNHPALSTLSKMNVKKAGNQSSLLIWVLLKMGQIESAGKSGKSYLYKKTFKTEKPPE